MADRLSGMRKADEYYLEARDAVMAAARAAAPGRQTVRLRTPDGSTLRIFWRTPLRIYLLMIDRHGPGECLADGFNFQRNGRVNLTGPRGVPLRQAMAAGHEPWVSREELLQLADQIRVGVPL